MCLFWLFFEKHSQKLFFTNSLIKTIRKKRLLQIVAAARFPFRPDINSTRCKARFFALTGLCAASDYVPRQLAVAKSHALPLAKLLCGLCCVLGQNHLPGAAARAHKLRAPLPPRKAPGRWFCSFVSVARADGLRAASGYVPRQKQKKPKNPVRAASELLCVFYLCYTMYHAFYLRVGVLYGRVGRWFSRFAG